MPLIHKPALKLSMITGCIGWLAGAIYAPLITAVLFGLLVLIMVLFSMGFDETLIKIGG